MNEFLKNKNVLITGASSGLGRELAFQVAANGGRPILVARNIEALKETAGQVELEYERKCAYYPCDLSDFDAIHRLVEMLKAEQQTITVLINCAGFGLFERAEETPFEVTKEMFDVNVLGLIKLTQELIPVLRNNRRSHIINIASQAGKMATPKSAVYAATKFAVIGYSNALRMELAEQRTNVTIINPGPIATEFFERADQTGNYLKSVGRFALKPKKVAKKTVKIIGTEKREVNLPRSMNLVSKLYQLFPVLIEKLGKKAFMKK
ncbi:SDR family NAD(P)-dependent oxidoreductase [Listeria costaricensis]|uniref:SDR family NAD(P)-dependent oxidoreductase n=1 Tax=Listeria costaricensis TaxID=2026604 RepID=UPI000C0729D0|nr:SDR family oxidoreductase [Listeria costaricensis]